MATALFGAADAASSFIRNSEVPYNYECQNCLLQKSEFQTLVNEIKLITKSIDILKEELLKDNQTTPEHVHNLVCDEKLDTSHQQCNNCYHLEHQLKDVQSELSSLKLIVEILNEEIKTLKQTSNPATNNGNPWLYAKPTKSQEPAISQQRKEEFFIRGTSLSRQ
jgi:hypothetical protein